MYRDLTRYVTPCIGLEPNCLATSTALALADNCLAAFERGRGPHLDLGAGAADAGDDAGVVERVAEDEAALADERRDADAVGCKPHAVRDRVLFAEELLPSSSPAPCAAVSCLLMLTRQLVNKCQRTRTCPRRVHLAELKLRGPQIKRESEAKRQTTYPGSC